MPRIFSNFLFALGIYIFNLNLIVKINERERFARTQFFLMTFQTLVDDTRLIYIKRGRGKKKKKKREMEENEITALNRSRGSESSIECNYRRANAIYKILGV